MSTRFTGCALPDHIQRGEVYQKPEVVTLHVGVPGDAFSCHQLWAAGRVKVAAVRLEPELEWPFASQQRAQGHVLLFRRVSIPGASMGLCKRRDHCLFSAVTFTRPCLVSFHASHARLGSFLY